MENQNHLSILLQGVEVWNAWRTKDSSIEPDLRGANIGPLNLEGINFRYVHLEKADLSGVCLKNSTIEGSYLQEAMIYRADLSGCVMNRTHLEKANILKSDLRGVQLWDVDLRGAHIYETHLEGAELNGVRLGGADLFGSFFDEETKLSNVFFFDRDNTTPSLADVHWGNVNLSVVDWAPVKVLGNERIAHQKKTQNGKVKEKVTRMVEYRAAVRANRQLAAVLREQGLNEEADHFAYRAQCLQRTVWRQQGKWLKFLFFWFLYLLAGYGYRPLRSLFWYLIIIFGFALAYYGLGHLSLWPPDAIVYSLTSFHGRGFFPGLQSRPSLHDPLVMLAAFEAVIGLFIEISFIATFTQRFFGR